MNGGVRFAPLTRSGAGLKVRRSRTGWAVTLRGVVRFRGALAPRVPAKAGVPSRGAVPEAGVPVPGTPWRSTATCGFDRLSAVDAGQRPALRGVAGL